MKKQFVSPAFEVADFESLESLAKSSLFAGVSQSEEIAADDIRDFSEIERLFK